MKMESDTDINDFVELVHQQNYLSIRSDIFRLAIAIFIFIVCSLLSGLDAYPFDWNGLLALPKTIQVSIFIFRCIYYFVLIYIVVFGYLFMSRFNDFHRKYLEGTKLRKK